MNQFNQQIVERYITAKPIADVQRGLPAFKALVEEYTRHEAFAKTDLERLQEYLKAREAKDDAAAERANAQLKANESSRRAIWSELHRLTNFRRIQTVASDLFLGILQAYVLEPKNRRGIESASRFWAKKTIVVRDKPPRGMNLDMDQLRAFMSMKNLEAYLNICAELHKQTISAGAAIVDGTLNSDPELAAKVKRKVGSFTLVNTGGFDDKVMARVADVVERSEKAMRGIGLGRVCYGDILVSKTIARQNTLAFYLISSDEMFIRANIRQNLDSILTVCHELAHRLQFQFLKDKVPDIKKIYGMLKTQSFLGPDVPDEILPKIGDTAEQGGKLYTVIEVQRYNDKVRLTQSDAPAALTASTSIANWLKLKGIEPHQNPRFRGFITHYAGKDPDENFAEMVAYYALGKLPTVQVEMLTPLL